MKQFKIRASCAHLINTNPRDESDAISKTAQSYAEDWVKEQLYGHKKEFSSKYTDKGIMVEGEALQYYADLKELGFVMQNEKYYEDEFFSGTPDLVLKDCVYDFKASWDCFTFPLFDESPVVKYVQQLQIYMHLTGIHKSKLVYTLQNTPEELDFGEGVKYDEIDDRLRVKEYCIDYDPEFIKSTQERVALIRGYVQSLMKKIK